MIEAKLSAIRGRFFDKAAVQNAIGKKAANALSRFGAFTMKRAQTSIRAVGKRAKKAAAKSGGRVPISAPGEPPVGHTGALRKNIFFAYDGKKKSVVIGPVLLNGSDGTVPKMLEFGGFARRGKKTARYRPRPFMRPAFDKEIASGKHLKLLGGGF